MNETIDRVPLPGEIYRHFKNKLYQVIGVATHSETGEKMVVYQALYGNFGLYVRPLKMFVSRVDREKYPDADQEYRFEKADLSDCMEEQGQMEEVCRSDSEPNPDLVAFLEAETTEQKLAALARLSKTASQTDLNSLAAVLDADLGQGSVADQIENVRKLLEIQRRYDGSRLRSR